MVYVSALDSLILPSLNLIGFLGFRVSSWFVDPSLLLISLASLVSVSALYSLIFSSLNLIGFLGFRVSSWFFDSPPVSLSLVPLVSVMCQLFTTSCLPLAILISYLINVPSSCLHVTSYWLYTDVSSWSKDSFCGRPYTTIQYIPKLLDFLDLTWTIGYAVSWFAHWLHGIESRDHWQRYSICFFFCLVYQRSCPKVTT